MMARSLCVVAVLLMLSCAGPAQPPQPTTIENIDLGLTLAGLPEGLVLAANQGTSLELQPADEMTDGIVWFEVGPERDGVNLVAAVKTHQERIEGMVEGAYMGGQELQGDFGTAFYSRGRYIEQGESLEETVVFMIHPTDSRLLAIHYRYPAGDDSAARVEQLIDVVSYLE